MVWRRNPGGGVFVEKGWRIASESGINSRGGINSSRGKETRLSEIAFKYPFTDQIARIGTRSLSLSLSLSLRFD